MSLANILSYLETQTATAAGIGIVRKYMMYVSTAEALRDNFMSAGVVNTVEFTRYRTDDKRISQTRTQRSHIIHFHFYYGLKEASGTETTARAVVEAVHDVFRDDYRLGGNADYAGPFHIEESTHILKAGVLCHYARGVFTCREDVQP